MIFDPERPYPERPWALRLHICWSQEASGVRQILRMKALIDSISVRPWQCAYRRVATETCAAIHMTITDLFIDFPETIQVKEAHFQHQE